MRWILVPALALVAVTAAHAQDLDMARLRLAQQHFSRGLDYVRGEQFASAVPEFKAAAAYDPLLALAHYELGRAYAALGRHGDAIGAYLACREAYGRLERLTAADAEERLRVLEIAWAAHRVPEWRVPTARGAAEPPELALALGSAHFRTGDLVRAEQEYLRAIDARPAFGEAHNNLAVVYLETGRLQLAQRALRAAQKAGYLVHPGLRQTILTGREGS